jgi:type I restriction enzyme M protein
MLDAETKRKIDGLRDTLVGKIPVPTEQVKQITLGLIYKFMSDIDAENEEFGSKSFFNGEYQRYSWRYIMDRSLSSYDRVLLYSEGLEKMTLNPNIPQLFRDIFKGAFLPFRDPMVVDQFLKGINEFKYEHSEDLGDAFEYLLLVMGAQGKAGQFRTPRHIIDFIVKAVDPQKIDKILDPACGTAGFLISAFKHILNQNVDPRQKKPGSALSTAERNNLSKNFVGYDISLDWVRISLVNMYLHQFSEPKIYEYDTLTSLDRWQDNFDCILANPPFMTPKGGIRPHNRFSIKANRSEVLFVDYIVEHLNPSGKAGIIVPEGIIFQSANAYKALRKMLVYGNYLWSVVSLPAGVFNPYSGVKSSILLIDKVLAKRSNDILFLKVENDGYDLGAQRRPIEENDLPKVQKVITNYKQALITGRDFSEVLKEKDFANLIPKTKIAKSKDFNLSVDRYREVVSVGNRKWPMVELGEVIEEVKYTTKVQKSGFLEEGKYPIIDQSERFISGYWNNEDDVFTIHKPVIVFGDHTRALKYIDFDFVLGADGVKILIPNEKFIPKFLYYVLLNTEIKNLGYSRHFKELVRTKIPLPPLEVQQQIVSELDGYQKIIDGAKQVIANYMPIIKIDPSWEMVELGKVCEINPKKIELKNRDLEVSFVPMSNISEHEPNFESKEILQISDVYNGYTYFENGDILLAKITPCFENGKSGIAKNLKNKIGFGSTEFIVFRPSDKIMSEFVYYLIASDDFIENGKNHMTGSAGQKRLRMDFVKNYRIPLPPRKIQNQIITRIEEERKLVEMNKKLVEMFDQKIKEKIDEVWGQKSKSP